MRPSQPPGKTGGRKRHAAEQPGETSPAISGRRNPGAETGWPDQPSEGKGQIARRLKTLIALFFQAVLDHARQRRGDRRIGGAQLRRVVLEDGTQRLDGGLALERALAADHFVQHGAEAEDVAAMIGGLAAHLLGRHVSGGAEDHALRRVVRCAIRVASRPPAERLAQLRQTEIENLDAAIVGDEHVLGLDVPVDDAFLVRGGETGRHGDRVFDGLACDQRAVARACRAASGLAAVR